MIVPLHGAINNYRVVPRLLVGGYSYLLYDVSHWFMSLTAPTSTQATFVSVLVGASAAVFGLYTNSRSSK